MARKMGRNLKRAAAGLMACAAIALCAVSPAWGEERAGDVVNVTVPTRIDCTLGADGTVTSPGGLEVVNNGPQDLYVAASTVDDFGQKVEFAIDLGGSPLLSRAGGKDVKGEVEFAGSSRKGLGLAVSKLNRTSHAALMDAAAQGETPMFTVGFRFTFKALQGTMAISGEAELGKTLTAAVTGAQADAKLAYRWYRDGQLIAGAETASYTTNDADLGKKLKCEAYDADGRYVGAVSAEVGPIKGPEAFAVFSADDGSLNFYKRVDVPKAGEQFEGKTATEVYTGIETSDFLEGVDMSTGEGLNYPWMKRVMEVTSVKVLDPISPISTSLWFYMMTNLKTADVSLIDTSRTTNMFYMFAECTSLTSLDVSKFNTSKVTDMSGLFSHCLSLTSLNLSKWDTSSVTNMTTMFDGCENLSSLDLSKFNTSKVTDMSYMFSDCRSLTTLDISSFDTSNVTNMRRMFFSCSKLTSLDLSNFKTSSATDMSDMFMGCSKLTSLDISSFDTSNVTNMRRMFFSCSKLTSLDLSNFKTSSATDMSYMFSDCRSLTTLDISSFDTSNVTNMSYMFSDCSKLQQVKLGDKFAWKNMNGYLPTPNASNIPGANGKWYAMSNGVGYEPSAVPSNTADVYVSSKLLLPPELQLEAFAVFSADDGSLNFYKRRIVPKAGEQFEGRTATEVYMEIETRKYDYLDVPWFYHKSEIVKSRVVDAVRPSNTTYWFAGMKSLSSLDLSKLDTSNVTDMSWMFNECSRLTDLDLSSWDTSSVTDMNAMFYNCTSLINLNLANWNTSSVVDLTFMFADCDALTALDLSNFKTSSVTDMLDMFMGCDNLTTLDLSSFDTSKVTNMSSMFSSCPSLTTLDLSSFDTSNVTDMSYMFRDCRSLTTLDISSFDTSSIGTMHWMFSNCRKLQQVKLGDKFIWKDTEGYLPSPSWSHIHGANGYWYDAATGEPYKPEEIPSNKAATYVAVNPIKAPVVTVVGEAIYGSTLTARVSGQPADTTATSYQWQSSKNGKDGWADSKLSGAQTSILELTENNLSGSPEGFYYRCVVSTTAGKKRVPQGISGAVGPVGKIGAFAVFSADDNSLSFYNRVGKPAEGSQFDGRTATKVYADIEKTDFISASNALWADKAPVIRTIRFRDVVKPNSTKNWFANMTSLERISLANLDMSACSDMSSMFYNCTSLSSVDTADVNTASVTSMQNLFENCSKLTALDLSKFRTTSVTNMSRIFSGCSSLSDIKLTGLDVSRVENLSYMFYNCSSLTALDVSGFTTAAATNMHSMFYGCSNLRELDLSGFDTSKVTLMDFMFNGDVRLQTVRLGQKFAWKGPKQPYLPAPSATYIPGATGKWYAQSTGTGYVPSSIPSNKADVYTAVPQKAPDSTNAADIFAVYSADDESLTFYSRANVPSVGSYFDGHTVTAVYKGFAVDVFTKYDTPWYDYTSNIRSVRFADRIAPVSTAYWFSDCYNLTSVDLDKFLMNNLIDTHYMFFDCNSLQKIDVANWDMSKVTMINNMFHGCTSLQSIDVSSWNTSTITNMSSAFRNCSNLRTIGVANWDTSRVQNMAYMFEGCNYLQNLDVSRWNVSQVTDMRSMFKGCTNLARLAVGSWQTSRVRYMQSMFQDCANIDNLDTSKWNTSSVCDMTSMFNNCVHMTNLDMSSWNNSRVSLANNMFTRCHRLMTVKIGTGFSWKGRSSYLPVPDVNIIPRADGLWHDASGRTYNPADIPSYMANTYYAYPVTRMIDEDVVEAEGEMDTSDETASVSDSEPVPSPEPAPAPKPERKPEAKPESGSEPESKPEPESEPRPEPGSVPEPGQVPGAVSEPDDLESVSVDASA